MLFKRVSRKIRPRKHRPQTTDLLENADPENANLENADLENGDLENADLENADLENRDLENADIENTDLENTNKYRNTVNNSSLCLGANYGRNKI